MKNNKNGLFKSSLFYIIVFVLAMGVILFATGGGTGGSSAQSQKIQSSQFTNDLKDNKIKSFAIESSDGVYKVTGEYRTPQKVKQDNGMSFNVSSKGIVKAPKETTKTPAATKNEEA